MKKTTFFRGRCQAKDITIYFIGTERELVHTSFDRKAHEQALAGLMMSGAGICDERTFEFFGREFADYLRGELRTFSTRTGILFSARGTPFQQKVWKLIKSIPYGETRSYGELAAMLGNRHYARAVGQACGANPLALLVPCHRVVGGNNNLGGFRGGSKIKARLLKIEKGRENRSDIFT